MLERRSFLKMLLAGGALTALPYSKVNNVRIDEDILFAQLRDNWISKFSVLPEDFLQTLGEITRDTHKYKAQVTEDFINGDILDFNGLILSKTESACLSLLSAT